MKIFEFSNKIHTIIVFIVFMMMSSCASENSLKGFNELGRLEKGANYTKLEIAVQDQKANFENDIVLKSNNKKYHFFIYTRIIDVLNYDWCLLTFDENQKLVYWGNFEEFKSHSDKIINELAITIQNKYSKELDNL